MGDQPVFKEVMVNIVVFLTCGKQGRVSANGLPLSRVLQCYEERENEGLQHGKYVGDLLGHPYQAFRCELVDKLMVEDVHEGLSVAVHLVARDVPL